VPIRIDLFCEDSAHENVARALLARIAGELPVEISVTARSARFGIGRLKRELRAFQQLVRTAGGSPDVLVVLVDANRVGVATRKREVADVIDESVFPAVVVGAPDPCVERWLLADPPAFSERFGVEPDVSSARAKADWKRRLAESLERAGEIVTQGGASSPPRSSQPWIFTKPGDRFRRSPTSRTSSAGRCGD